MVFEVVKRKFQDFFNWWLGAFRRVCDAVPNDTPVQQLFLFVLLVLVTAASFAAVCWIGYLLVTGVLDFNALMVE